MHKFAIAVKALIIDNNKVLLLRRRSNDVHTPGALDIPGGRLEPGEDHLQGLKREVKEEANLEVEVKMPLQVNSFTRDDNQRITMIIFLCTPLSFDVELSEEHVEYKWLDLTNIEEFPDWINSAVGNVMRYGLHNNN